MTHNAVRERGWNLWQADISLRSARKIAVERHDWIDDRQGNWAYAEHRRYLQEAFDFYVAAGLGLLAGRVRWLAQASTMNVVSAWEKFDRLNAGGCGVA